MPEAGRHRRRGVCRDTPTRSIASSRTPTSSLEQPESVVDEAVQEVRAPREPVTCGVQNASKPRRGGQKSAQGGAARGTSVA